MTVANLDPSYKILTDEQDIWSGSTRTHGFIRNTINSHIFSDNDNDFEKISVYDFSHLEEEIIIESLIMELLFYDQFQIIEFRYQHISDEIISLFMNVLGPEILKTCPDTALLIISVISKSINSNKLNPRTTEIIDVYLWMLENDITKIPKWEQIITYYTEMLGCTPLAKHFLDYSTDASRDKFKALFYLKNDMNIKNILVQQVRFIAQLIPYSAAIKFVDPIFQFYLEKKENMEDIINIASSSFLFINNNIFSFDIIK